MWAIYWLFSAKIPVDAVIKLFVGFLSGTLLSFFYALLNEQLIIDFKNLPWAAILYVGLFEMGITFFIWLKALQITPNVAKLGNFIYLTPFLSLILLAIILKEQVQLTTIIGLIVIISGILSQQYWRTKKINL